MSKERLFQDIPDIVLKNYDMFVDTRVKKKYARIKIYTWIVFTPKKINTLTPKPTNFYSEYIYSEVNDTLSYDDATYIRENDMPILKYISGEYYFDEFCEKLARKSTEEVIEKVKSGEDVKNITISDIVVYLNYFRNNF